jgi:cytidine deaminase
MARELGMGDWERLSEAAWRVRENSYLVGKTAVGAAVLDGDGKIHVGCNLEHIFRSHDIHAEVNAISSMVAAGGRKFMAILVVARREFFTPCGSCMDWIMEMGGPQALVGFQPEVGAEIRSWSASELMPHYPQRL